MDSIREKTQEVFREVFGNSELVLADDLTPTDVEQWDSMGHLNLMIALEKCFGIKFTTTEIPEMQSVVAIVSLVKEKVGMD